MDLNKQTLWTASFRRENLIELIEGHGQRPKKNTRLLDKTPEVEGELLGIWSATEAHSLSPLPQVIVGSQRSLEDLFAWSASYLRAMGPISSLVRILTLEQFSDLLNIRPPVGQWDIAGGAVGIIIGEVLSSSSRSVGLKGAATATPNITLSFAIFRAWALGFPASVFQEIFESYVKLSRNLGRPFVDDICPAVMQVVTSLLETQQSSGEEGVKRLGLAPTWIRKLREGVNVYDLASEVMQLSSDLFHQKDAEQIRNMTAEERVQSFDMYAPSIFEMREKSGHMDAAFSLALGAFLCRPGFAQQLSLLKDYTGKMPESVLWLGALQAFTPITDILLIEGGVGWRIARELYRSENIWASPRADAVSMEVNMLGRGKSMGYRRLMERARLEIEIYPLITTAFRGPRVAMEQMVREEAAYTEEIEMHDRMVFDKLVVLEAQLDETLQALRELHYRKQRTRN